MLFNNIPDVLSQLIRTAIIPSEEKVFAVADFSAIEARVLAWLAGEEWRLDVFRTHGKIYEASAAKMFKVDINSIGKGSELRQRGKVAELALGYQGSVGAMRTMDTAGQLAHMSDEAVKHMVQGWRKANPMIVDLWASVEETALQCVSSGKTTETHGLIFTLLKGSLSIELPSGRSLWYYGAKVRQNAYGKQQLIYQGTEQQTKQWGYLDSYGGKLVENIVQAIARDILAEALYNLEQNHYRVVMHIHDEVVCEVDHRTAESDLQDITKIMVKPLNWATNLPLGADGFITTYYKKD